MPALLLQLQVNDFAEREASGESDENVVRPDAIKKTVVQAAESQHTIEVVPSAIDKCKSGPLPQARGNEGGAVREHCDMVSGDDEDAQLAITVPTSSAEERERLRTWGMDWGLVTVWCCPRSCDASCEEVVAVQLPV